MPAKDTGRKLNVSAADARVPTVHQGEISQRHEKMLPFDELWWEQDVVDKWQKAPRWDFNICLQLWEEIIIKIYTTEP